MIFAFQSAGDPSLDFIILSICFRVSYELVLIAFNSISNLVLASLSRENLLAGGDTSQDVRKE